MAAEDGVLGLVCCMRELVDTLRSFVCCNGAMAGRWDAARESMPCRYNQRLFNKVDSIMKHGKCMKYHEIWLKLCLHIT